MTIDEAIQTLKKLALPIKTESDYKNHMAVRLGIAALERERERRFNPRITERVLLPGESSV
jgi:hypothetical protein